MAGAVESPGTVLVTGGTGFLASWVIANLLGRGFGVRTTVRDPGKADQVRAAVAEAAGNQAAARLEFAAADLLGDDGWDAAVAGVDYVVHTASPLGTAAGADLIRVAREGVRRVLGAADRAGVRRVVLTSSGVAAVPGDLTKPAVESVWGEVTGNRAQAYDDSKILAERDAWEIASTAGFGLVTVLPTFIQGPVLGRPNPTGSSQIVGLLLAGGIPAIPNIGWDVIDVRDVAELHVLALTEPAAAGQRLLGGSGSFLWWRDFATILRTELGKRADRVTTRRMPDLMVKLVARTNPQMAMIRSRLGRKVIVDSSKARELLGWEPTRTAAQTIVDTAESLLADRADGGPLGRASSSLM